MQDVLNQQGDDNNNELLKLPKSLKDKQDESELN